MFNDVFAINPLVASSISKIYKEILLEPTQIELFCCDKKTFKFVRDKEKVIYFLEDGEIELCNSENNLIIANIKPPAIFGISTLFTDRDYHFIRSVSETRLHCIHQKEFIKIIENKKLWKDVSLILSWYLELYSSRDSINATATNSYSIVKIYLELLWGKGPDECKDISIFNFILSRTAISRSSLNKIIKDLSDGGYIKVNRGRLVYLKQLPHGY